MLCGFGMQSTGQEAPLLSVVQEIDLWPLGFREGKAELMGWEGALSCPWLLEVPKARLEHAGMVGGVCAHGRGNGMSLNFPFFLPLTTPVLVFILHPDIPSPAGIPQAALMSTSTQRSLATTSDLYQFALFFLVSCRCCHSSAGTWDQSRNSTLNLIAPVPSLGQLAGMTENLSPCQANPEQQYLGC